MKTVIQEFKLIPQAWKQAWESRKFRNQFVLTLMGFYGIMEFNLHMLVMFEKRLGAVIYDPIQQLMPPMDFSMPITLMLYSSLILALVSVLARPHSLVMGFQVYALVVLARTFTIGYLPLEPAPDIISLNDPVLRQMFKNAGSEVVNKDLFFSGHIAGMALFLLMAPFRGLRVYLGLVGLTMGLMLICQRVHYSYDVVAAPVITYLLYRMVLWFHQESSYGLKSDQSLI